jgi:hypothetical protein
LVGTAGVTGEVLLSSLKLEVPEDRASCSRMDWRVSRGILDCSSC